MIRIVLLVLALLVSAGASAQAWPTKPVHFIVAGAAGSAPDIIARLIGERLTQMWGQQVVVENRVGSAGNVGTAAAAKAAPDGYTILFGQAAPLALSPIVFKQLDFDPEKDFVPVVRVGLSPMMVSAGKDFAPKTIPELIAAAKAAPGKINYGTSSQRNIPHLTGVLLANNAGVQLTHVPYSSNSLAATEASTGLTQLYIDGIPPMTGHIKAGRLRPIAVTSSKRLSNFPDIPTVAETLPGFEFNGWFALLAPAGTPPAILARINRDMNTVLRSPDIVERLLGFGIYEPGGTPEELAAFMRSERDNYRKAVRAGGIEPGVIDTDILIAGGGPVGLGLACELGWRGVRCVVVEERREFLDEPVAKVNLVNARSMEFCRRWGIEKEVRHAGFPDDFPMSILFATSMRGKAIARIPYPSMGEQSPHPASPTNRQRIPQGLLDGVLRRAAQRFESVDVAFETRLVAFADKGTHVEAEVVRAGRVENVRARYLVGADGARSMVRESLGIGLVGEPRLNTSCGIYFRSPRLWRQHDKGKAIMTILVGRDGMWANLNAIDGYSTWRLSVYREVDPAEAPALLHQAMGGPFEAEIRAVNPWIRRAVVAERMQHGNCFLIGDAAHQLSPTGGFA